MFATRYSSKTDCVKHGVHVHEGSDTRVVVCERTLDFILHLSIKLCIGLRRTTAQTPPQLLEKAF